MSRAWIAFYMGDYLKKTQRLTSEQHGAYLLLLIECWQAGRIPLDDESRAAIARIPLARWKKIGSAVAAFFNEEGVNKRATEEIEKAEKVSLRRAWAGKKGGEKSGISRAFKSGEAIRKQERSKDEANLKQTTKQEPKQNGSICEANHKEEITTSESVAAREESSLLPGELATAPPAGALARPDAEPVAKRKPASEYTRAELDELYAKRRMVAR